MPTLLQINVTANWGSTGKIAEQIGLVAQQHGWESYIAYGRDMNPSKNKLIKIGSKLDVFEHYLENRFFDNEGRASRRATKRFLKEVDQIKPDVIHLHNIHDHYLNYELLFDYLSSKKIPVVWTFHDCWAFTGHCTYFDTVNCNRWIKECYDCLLKNKYSLDKSISNYRRKKSDFTSLDVLTIVPVSNWIGELARQSFFRNGHIKIIKNGIDLHVFKPTPSSIRIRFNIGDRMLIVGCASIWSERKGLDDFIKIRNKLSVKDYAIILIGLTDKQISMLPEGVIGIKRTNSTQELVEIYTASDVYVNPTYSDNYPTTNLEALACGTPVITYNTGGSPEAVDENTGIVVPQGDVNALSEAIIKLRKKPLSPETCRKRAEDYFDKDKCFYQYVELYNELLKDS